VSRAPTPFIAAHRRESPLESVLRILLFAYVVLVASPLRFWLIRDDDAEYTWIFAYNFGAAHGLAFGRDLIGPHGPLGFLTFPQNIGQTERRYHCSARLGRVSARSGCRRHCRNLPKSLRRTPHFRRA